MARIIVIADHTTRHLTPAMDRSNIQDIDLEDLDKAILLLEELADAVQWANLEAAYSSS